MYQKYFKLDAAPFSIAPDPEFLYMGPGHKDALAHLSYVLHQSGGFVLLTGEVGTGKTTVCRAFLKTLPSHIALAFIINPKLSGIELLMAIARELDISAPEQKDSRFAWQQVIYEKLLELHGQGKQTLLMIDEAQNLAPEVLEEVRLLTNLETDKHKLLSIILMGQPELQKMLCHYELRQLNQRITARFHIKPLTVKQTNAYLSHRLKVAGLNRSLFSPMAKKQLYQLSAGIPRLINVLADRALLAAYVNEKKLVNRALVKKASKEILVAKPSKPSSSKAYFGLLLLIPLLVAAGLNAEFILSRFKVDPEITAKQQMASYWQLEASKDPCNEDALRCYQGYMRGSVLSKLGHPLITFNASGDEAWVSVDDLNLLSRAERIKVLIAWQAPGEYEKSVRPGDEHNIIAWLRVQLETDDDLVDANGWEVIRPASFNEKVLDPGLVKKLKKFQLKHGLLGDGVLGPKTLMMFNKAMGLLPQATGKEAV